MQRLNNQLNKQSLGGDIMTTREAEKLYLAQHKVEHEYKGYAIYNPKNKPVEELPFIYGFNNGGSAGWYSAQLIAEDGHAMGSHACSHEGYMKHDLGILEGTRSDRHEGFRKHYPDGYRMDFISSVDVKGHKGLDRAYELNQELSEEAKKKKWIKMQKRGYKTAREALKEARDGK